MSRELLKIFLLALLLRFVLAPLAHHSDVIDPLNWGKNLENFGFLGFYSRTIPDAGPPNYPPGFYYILAINQWIYRLVKNILWKINLGIPLFPSGFYLWFESDLGRIFFNKLPAIFADLGIGYLIYLFVSQIKNKKLGLISLSLFLFSPPIWFNSAVWGQTESLFAFPLLLSFYLLYRKRLELAVVFLILSFLVKPTVILVLPIFAYWWLKDGNRKRLFGGAVLAITLFYIVHLPFNLRDTSSFILNLYQYNIREILGYLVANAFNLWGLFFGFKPKVDSILLLGIPAYAWGISLYVTFSLCLLSKLQKNKDPKIYFLSAALLAFAGFLFLTRIHERYFYLTLLFLAPLTTVDKKLRNIFFLLSGVYFLNLYHFWWIPRIEILINFLSFGDHLIPRILSFVNFLIMIYLFRYFLRQFKPSKL